MRIIDADVVINSMSLAIKMVRDDFVDIIKADKELVERQFELPTFQSNDICKYCRYCDNVTMAPGMVEDKVGMVVEYCKGCGSKNGFDKFRGKLVAEVIKDETD